MEIGEFQHQDFVWTWKSNRAGSRVSLWLPYFDGVERVKGTRYRFRYNGGEFEADLKQVDFIMLYGASGTLPVQFLDDLNTQRITLFVHRRNAHKSAYVAAYVARREAYFDRLGVESSRRESGPWKSALDAGSMFPSGVVRALRASLVGASLRLVLPVEGVRAGGRPPRTGYALPGAMLAQA